MYTLIVLHYLEYPPYFIKVTKSQSTAIGPQFCGCKQTKVDGIFEQMPYIRSISFALDAPICNVCPWKRATPGEKFGKNVVAKFKGVTNKRGGTRLFLKLNMNEIIINNGFGNAFFYMGKKPQHKSSNSLNHITWYKLHTERKVAKGTLNLTNCIYK